MTRGGPTKLVAGCCALGAFAVAIVAGLGVDNPVDVILARAVGSMFVCYLVGAALGAVAERALDEAVAAHRARTQAAAHVPVEPIADEVEIVV